MISVLKVFVVFFIICWKISLAISLSYKTLLIYRHAQIFSTEVMMKNLTFHFTAASLKYPVVNLT